MIEGNNIHGFDIGDHESERKTRYFFKLSCSKKFATDSTAVSSRIEEHDFSENPLSCSNPSGVFWHGAHQHLHRVVGALGIQLSLSMFGTYSE